MTNLAAKLFTDLHSAKAPVTINLYQSFSGMLLFVGRVLHDLF